jgi:L-amino acid N-acyltransferase YncA
MDDPIDWLRSAPPGTRAVIPVQGHSFAPVARAGDSVKVERCGPGDVRRGDLVVVRRGDHWTAALVTDAFPLRTALLRGSPAPETGEVRARVVAVRRGRITFRYGGAARIGTRILRRVLAGPLGRLRRALRAAVEAVRRTPLSRSLRSRRVGGVRVRRLTQADVRLLDRFARRHMAGHRAFLAERLRNRWMETGIPLGAFDRQGRLVGFLYVDEYRAEGVEVDGVWVRRVVVAPAARGLGAGRRLMEAVCAEADALGLPAVLVDVRESNAASLATMRAAGFVPVPEPTAARALSVLEGGRPGERLVILERRRGAGGAG